VISDGNNLFACMWKSLSLLGAHMDVYVVLCLGVYLSLSLAYVELQALK